MGVYFRRIGAPARASAPVHIHGLPDLGVSLGLELAATRQDLAAEFLEDAWYQVGVLIVLILIVDLRARPNRRPSHPPRQL